MSYRISTVAQMTGIPRNTLIAWERRYQLIQPERQPNGYRYYSDEDVSDLLRVKNALNAGLKISEAVELFRQRREGSGESEPAVVPTVPQVHQPSPQDCQKLVHALYSALVGYRGAEARLLIEKIGAYPLDNQLHDIFFPTLRLVGDGWERGQLSVAQEHYAVGFVRSHLAALFMAESLESVGAPHVACTTPPLDEHEVVALALSVHLAQRGFRTSYLGPKMPTPDLLGFCEKEKPMCLCISSILTPMWDGFEDYLQEIAKLPQKGTRVVLGGAGLRDLAVAVPPTIEVVTEWESFDLLRQTAPGFEGAAS